MAKDSRPRYRAAGGKSDPGDAYLLADLLRTDGHRFRPLAPCSEEIKALRALVRGRDDLVATRIVLARGAPRQGPSDTELQVLAHRDGAVVEQAMMQCAERQTIRHLVRPTVRMPADMGGIHRDQPVDQPQREAADATLGEVRLEHRRTEGGVAPARRDSSAQLQAYCLEDLLIAR